MARPLPGLYSWAQTWITSPFCDVEVIRQSKEINTELGFIWEAVIWQLNNTGERTMEGGSEVKDCGVRGCSAGALCLEHFYDLIYVSPKRFTSSTFIFIFQDVGDT